MKALLDKLQRVADAAIADGAIEDNGVVLNVSLADLGIIVRAVQFADKWAQSDPDADYYGPALVEQAREVFGIVEPPVR